MLCATVSETSPSQSKRNRLTFVNLLHTFHTIMSLHFAGSPRRWQLFHFTDWETESLRGARNARPRLPGSPGHFLSNHLVYKERPGPGARKPGANASSIPPPPSPAAMPLPLTAPALICLSGRTRICFGRFGARSKQSIYVKASVILETRYKCQLYPQAHGLRPHPFTPNPCGPPGPPLT